MIPFTPHLAYECLEINNCKGVNNWPKIDSNILEEIKLAVQVNGKTRDIITIKDLVEKDVNQFILKSSKANKYFDPRKKLLKLYL